MLQDITIGRGGTVLTEFVGRRPVSCTIQIIRSDGTDVVAQTATGVVIDPVSTTATAVADKDDTTISVASAASISSDGTRYLFDGEEVTVKSVSGSVVELWSPLARDHASGATFKGVRVSYAVDASLCASEFRDAIALFAPDTGTPQAEIVNCVRFPIPYFLIGLADVRDVVPKQMAACAIELDIPRSLLLARNKTILELGQSARADSILGVDHLRIIAAHQWWLDREVEFGDQWADQMNTLRGEKLRLVDLVKGQAARSDGSGGTVPGPGGPVIPDINIGWI